MIAWLAEAPGPKWVAFDDALGEFVLTDNANDPNAVRYETERAAKDAIFLLTDPDRPGGQVAPKLIATEHEWPEVSP